MKRYNWRRVPFIAITLVSFLGGPATAAPRVPSDGGDAKPLSAVPVPRPANLRDFVRNDTLAAALGKALFWDAQVGGDGIQACATCHFSAGADPRTLNTAHPGPDGIFEEVALAGQITADRFPIRSDDRIGSQGVVDKRFSNIAPGSAVDSGTVTPNATFLDQRQVTGRNTPTGINSVFNFETFWDGRAKNVFNGRTPGGPDPTALLLRVGSGGSVSKVTVSIPNSAAASQAVGPPNNDVEMSWDGRAFIDLGKKLLSLRPLGQQQVASDDSALAALRHSSGTGLNRGYADLIRATFQDRWWNSDVVVDRNLNVIRRGTPSGLNEFSVMEANFSMFWGLAIQMYVSTLISGDSPFDRFAKGNSSALTSLQKLGMDVFNGEGRCDHCHGSGGVFTEAAEGTGGDAFAFTGVRPATEDLGRAGGEPGRMKTSTIRNTELTGPYFHNGGYATLRQVVDFYDRGGDFPNDELQTLELTEVEKVALVAFMLSTTDDRVRFRRAPFDHPSLPVPNGTALPAIGRNGLGQTQTFLGLDPFDPGSSSAPMMVSGDDDQPGRAGGKRLTLVSYLNRGKDYRLFVSIGGPIPELSSGIKSPSRADLDRLGRTRGLRLVGAGTLDSIGVAEVPVDVPPSALGSAAPEYFFAVVDPVTGGVLALSNSTRIVPAP